MKCMDDNHIIQISIKINNAKTQPVAYALWLVRQSEEEERPSSKHQVKPKQKCKKYFLRGLSHKEQRKKGEEKQEKKYLNTF